MSCEPWLSWLSPPVSRCRHGWAEAVGGFVDRDSSWLHGECRGPCVYRDILTASPEQGAYCLWEWRSFWAPLCQFLGSILIQVGSVFSRMTSHLSIVNHWHSCFFCRLMQLVLKLGWCTHGNFLEIAISERTRNMLWHAGPTAAWWCHWDCHVKQIHLLPHERIWHEILK